VSVPSLSCQEHPQKIPFLPEQAELFYLCSRNGKIVELAAAGEKLSFSRENPFKVVKSY
jgi:hypothetical protein